MTRRELVANWLAQRDGFTTDAVTEALFLEDADELLKLLDGLPMWTLKEVADWAGLRNGTVSSYHTRGQMPPAAMTYGRTHLWEPDVIKAWRPQGYPHASRS